MGAGTTADPRVLGMFLRPATGHCQRTSGRNVVFQFFGLAAQQAGGQGGGNVKLLHTTHVLVPNAGLVDRRDAGCGVSRIDLLHGEALEALLHRCKGCKQVVLGIRAVHRS